MLVFMKSRQLHAWDIQGTETVGDVKTLVEEREQLAVKSLAVFHKGRLLVDDTLLARLGDVPSLLLEVRQLRGKVHGPLSRAGKVKGQTPKVEPQEKKKKKKSGRAKQRAKIQPSLSQRHHLWNRERTQLSGREMAGLKVWKS